MTNELGKKKLKDIVTAGHATWNLQGSFLFQFDQGSAPSASSFTRQPEFLYFRKPTQNGVDCSAQVADTFAVDYTYLKNICLTALIQVIRQQTLQVLWRKIVQVKYTVNGNLNYSIIICFPCIIHGRPTLLKSFP